MAPRTRLAPRSPEDPEPQAGLPGLGPPLPQRSLRQAPGGQPGLRYTLPSKANSERPLPARWRIPPGSHPATSAQLADGTATGVPQSRPGSARLAPSFPWASGTAMWAESRPPGGMNPGEKPWLTQGHRSGCRDTPTHQGQQGLATPSVPSVLRVCQTRAPWAPAERPGILGEPAAGTPPRKAPGHCFPG